MARARVKEDTKAKARARTAKAEARAPKACSKAKEFARVSKEDPRHPKARPLCNCPHKLMDPPLPRLQTQLTSPATSVTRRVIINPNVPNGWHFDHPQRTSKRDSRHHALA